MRQGGQTATVLFFTLSKGGREKRAGWWRSYVETAGASRFSNNYLRTWRAPVSEALQGPLYTLNHETVRETVSISNMTAGRYYKAMKRFILQIMQAVSKKAKGILCVLREVMLQASGSGSADHMSRGKRDRYTSMAYQFKKKNLFSQMICKILVLWSQRCWTAKSKVTTSRNPLT